MMRKIFKNIAMIALTVCVAIGSFFVPVTKKQYNFASADYVDTDYTFHSSDTYYLSILEENWVANSVRPVLFNGNISTTGGNTSFQFIVYYTSSYSTSVNYSICDNLNFQYMDTSLVSYTHNDYIPINYDSPCRVLFSDASLSDRYSICVFYVDNGFNSNIYKVSLFLTDGSYWTDDADFKFLNIKYFDVNDKSFTFQFKVPNSFYFNNRTYFFNNPDNLTDNQIYNQGYQQGLVDNQEYIYDSGYNAGYDIGFDRGKVQGGAEANSYSFLGLIGAVVDAPVSILSSLFNFTFLGINLWSFITSLLTIALILFVVKIFMRR